MTYNNEQARSRINAVDALRGFALAGIVVAHMTEQFIAAPRPQAAWDVQPSLIDGIVMGLTFLLVQGKFFSIFAVLFGASFAIMMGNAEAKGQAFSGRFLWRLSILLVFGFLHSLLYRGDILTLYVLIGFTLPLFYHLSERVLTLIAGLLFLGLGRYLFLAITGTNTFLDYQNEPNSPQVAAYVELLKSGSFAEVVKENFVHGFASKFDFLFGVFGRAYQTIAYFIVGMWLVRSGILRKLAEYRHFFKRVLYWSLGLTPLWIALMLALFSQVQQPPDFTLWLPNIAFGFYDFANISLTAAFIAGFLLLCLRREEAFDGLAAYGRMALTCYIMQSLIGVVIFHGWALGMLGKLHDWQTLLMAFIIIGLQIQFCRLWLRHFRYGPLEWLWRCATYFRWVEFRREK